MAFNFDLNVYFSNPKSLMIDIKDTTGVADLLTGAPPGFSGILCFWKFSFLCSALYIMFVCSSFRFFSSGHSIVCLSNYDF
jgi:hypothetical protein